MRLCPTKIEPASTKIDITSSSARIEAEPCETRTADFIITNVGLRATIDVSVTDSRGFYDSSNANS